MNIASVKLGNIFQFVDKVQGRKCFDSVVSPNIDYLIHLKTVKRFLEELYFKVFVESLMYFNN